MKEQYNRRGELILEETAFQPADQKYMNDKGKPDWKTWIQYGDEGGFDVRNREANGKHIIRVVLPKGKKIIRYGLAFGSFTTDYGTPYADLSLPYTEDSIPYHEYVVIGKCEVECLVDRGRVAPGFGSKGGAIQYRHYMSIQESLLQEILEEDFSWLKH